MAGISGKQGKDLLIAILSELKSINPRIVPLDSDEIQALEDGVAQGVCDVFGSESPEYSEFEGFKIAAGNISRGDSRAEKQTKYELGLPKAAQRLEALLSLIDLSEDDIQDLSPEDLVEVEPAGKTPPAKPSPPKAVPRTRPNAPDAPSAARAAKPAPEPEPKPAPKAAETVKKTPQVSPKQPGRILLLQEGGDDISLAVAALLEKIGIDLALLDEDSSSEMEGIIGQKNMAFTIMSVSSGPRGGLSGLTSVIGKPYPKHESTFKLGLLVGSLGPGKVVILHSGERPQDIPEGLFGIRYIPYKEEGGWQIGLLKLLKANGFFIDANLLFD
ncbi:MAG: hypothetical protein P1S59_01710 [bacterium]|nr:hypothetical protein [bacterium]